MLGSMRRWLILAVMILLMGWAGGQVLPDLLRPGQDRSATDAVIEQVEPDLAGKPVAAQRGAAVAEDPPPSVRPVLPAAPTSTTRATDTPASPSDQRPRTASQALRDLRRQLTEAAQLGRAAQAGDAAAQAERDRRRAAEPDPRVRAALGEGVVPDLGRWRPSAPSLPSAAAPAPVGEVKAYWLTPGENGDGTYESAIQVDEQGRATIETVYEPTEGVRWRVRYNAWAYRDGDGNTVIDARGQEVDVIERPPWGWWSPDSMVVKPDGLVDLIDDKHDPGQGTTGARGPG